jgi:hypothetical protein
VISETGPALPVDGAVGFSDCFMDWTLDIPTSGYLDGLSGIEYGFSDFDHSDFDHVEQVDVT